MEQLLATIATSLPIVLLIGIGSIIRRTGLISAQGVEDFKKLIVNVALPAVLFVTFLSIEFDRRYIGLFVFVPIVLFLLLGLGYGYKRYVQRIDSAPFLMTGFEFGMLGIGLFGTAFGMDQIGTISVVGLPHELFIWFVYVTLLRTQYGGRVSVGATVRSFISSPVIVGIVLGTLLNALGLGGRLGSSAAGSALLETLGMLGNIVGPLILLIIGYGMRISWREVRPVLPIVAVRFVVVLGIGALVAPYVVETILGLPRIFTFAVFTFFILPPPFIVPLFTPSDRTDELVYSNNVLSVYTLASITTFLVFMVVTSI